MQCSSSAAATSPGAVHRRPPLVRPGCVPACVPSAPQCVPHALGGFLSELGNDVRVGAQGQADLRVPEDVHHDPGRHALLRLASCVLIEAHEEWQFSDRRYLSEASMALLNPPEPTALEPHRTAPSEVIDQPALQTA